MEWPQVELGMVAEIRGGATPRRDNPAYWNGDIAWLTPTDLPAIGTGVTEVATTQSYVTEEGLASCSASVLPTGTVLFSSRASIGKVGIAAVPLATNQGFANFIPRPGVDSRYLAWCLYFHASRIGRLAGSTTFKEVSKSSIRRFTIPLPAPSEQRRIVEILDRVDHLRRLRADADSKADEVHPAVFTRMFGDPATNPMGWKKWPLSALALKFSDGPFGSNLKTSHYSDDGIRVVRLQNIGVGEFLDTDKTYISPEHFGELSKHECLPGDVVVATLGDPNLRACILPPHIPRALNKADCVQVRPRQGVATSEFICWLINSPSTLQSARRLAHGQTRTRISMGLLKDLPVPVPGYELQEEFSRRARFAQGVLARQAVALHQVSQLWAHVIRIAFSGQLTTSWREARMKELLREMEQQAKALSAS